RSSLLVAVVERREESREIREQLRCCDWIRFPRANLRNHSKVKAGKRTKKLRVQLKTLNRFRSQKPEYLPVSTSFEPDLQPRSLIAGLLQVAARKNFFAKKKNESCGRGVPRSRERVCLSKVGGNLLCRNQRSEAVSGICRVARASRALVLASRQNNLLGSPRLAKAFGVANTRDARAPQAA